MEPEKLFDSMILLFVAHWVPKSIKSIIELKIAQQLEDGPKTTDQIAQAVQCDSAYLYRLMRALSSVGVFRQDEMDQKLFHQTILSACLAGEGNDNQENWINFFKFVHEPFLAECWDMISESVIMGKSAFNVKHGYPDGIWDIVKTKPEVFKVFHHGMTTMTHHFTRKILQDLDFNQFNCVVDLGGSEGYLVQKILEKNPYVKTGICLDLENVIIGNGKLDRSTIPSHVMDRYKEQAGSVFGSIPKADCYTMKSVLHGYNDDEVSTILLNLSSQMPIGSKLLIIEPIIGTKNQLNFPVWLDLLMALITNGKERSETDWKNLIQNVSGFSIESISNDPLSTLGVITIVKQ
ncbi:hypothetical protein DFA_05723 [Cavenderia fasciculata]|uniref:O-methyltransferase domain-containing protein n=1 Tax=Cavenderia fasciculata TaxID=261658 RepID=F4PM89_CACFS|nr:uncharacterized protein DFA_05723 [Cavenderia fasciculata]EGG23589.1 hypothetical protein DFA_05723 [Cavenderia fasciculata]|eukprot:XP_004361440.1 hypothetical protein DFA_05723 [Cavenderia fasciculata]